MKYTTAVMVGVALQLLGCSHATMRGTVAMKINEEESHVCMGEGEVKVGDQVALFENECRSTSGRENVQLCRKVRVGAGEIERILNEHYSVLRVAKGTPVHEGIIVERL